MNTALLGMPTLPAVLVNLGRLKSGLQVAVVLENVLMKGEVRLDPV